MKTIAFICNTCGVEFEPAEKPPEFCPICEDERQYVPATGQQWTTLAALNNRHKNIFAKITDDLYAIYSEPRFAIGQRAHLLVTPGGNILWDCISNIDESTIDIIQKLGGIKAICISHPHYFSTLTQWSRAFNNAPVYIHSLDEEWLQRKTIGIHLWEGKEQALWDGIKLIGCGGHFPGGNLLYWPGGKALLTGDVIQVCPDLESVSFMYSYPNYIPLPEKDILHIADCVAPLTYDTMYGAFGHYIRTNAKRAMDHSIKRYLSIFS